MPLPDESMSSASTIFSQLAVFTLVVSSYPCLAEDQWELTETERRRCETLVIASDAFPWEITVPRGAMMQGQSVFLNNRSWLGLNTATDFDARRARDFAVRIGKEIVLFEDNLVLVNAGAIEGHYFYYFHNQGGVNCLFFASGIPSKENAIFRLKCARTLRRTNQKTAHPQSIGTSRLAGVPESEYPRLRREWEFAADNRTVTGQLRDVRDRHAEIRTKTGDVLAGVHELDAQSRLLLLDAEKLFDLERELTGLCRAAEKMPEFNPEVAAWQQLVRDSERRLSRSAIRLRYRITGVSAQLPPEHTDSMVGEFKLSLRPLFSLQIGEHSVDDQRLGQRYLKSIYLPVEEFQPQQVTPGDSIAEFSGALRINQNLRGHLWQIRVAAAQSRSLLTLGFDVGAPRIFTPGKNANAAALDTLFAAQQGQHAADILEPQMAENDKLPEQAKQAAPRGRRERVTARDGERVSVVGRQKRRLVVCRDAAVTVSGTGHDVLVTGRCRKLTVSGTGNRVTLHEVHEISVAGSDNEIEYRTGPSGQDAAIRGSTTRNRIHRRD